MQQSGKFVARETGETITLNRAIGAWFIRYQALRDDTPKDTESGCNSTLV